MNSLYVELISIFAESKSNEDGRGIQALQIATPEKKNKIFSLVEKYSKKEPKMHRLRKAFQQHITDGEHFFSIFISIRPINRKRNLSNHDTSITKF